MKIVIYTAIFNGYDNLQDVSNLQHEDVTFLCISNCIPEHEATSKGWKLLEVNNNKSGTRLNRLFKLSTKYLPDNDINVYLDGNKWITDIKLLLTYCIHLHISNKQMILFKHWERTTVCAECKEVVNIGRAPEKETYEAYNSYIIDGFKDNLGLFCASVQIRKNTKEVNDFLEAWYEEFKKYPYRDQISLPYTIYKTNFIDSIMLFPCMSLLKFVENWGHLIG